MGEDVSESFSDAAPVAELALLALAEAANPFLIDDDLATLGLDLLVTEEGREPWGVNYMLVHGDPEAPPQPLLEEELR